MWPVLNSKAVAGKTISFFLTERAVSWANRPGATMLEKTLATCLWNYARMVEIMDSAKNIFTEVESKQFQEHCLLHLQAYGNLHVQGQAATGKQAGRNCFLLLPKHTLPLSCRGGRRKNAFEPKAFFAVER